MKNKKIKEQGIYLGIIGNNKVPVSFDSFKRNITGNSNSIVLGKPGVGMSFNVKKGLLKNK